MSQLVSELMLEANFGRMLSDSSVARFSPLEIRDAIQQLVLEERLDMANALSDAGLAIHPNQQELIAIASLVSIIRQEWVRSIELISDLMRLQDGNVQPFTHLMLVRALRSNLDLAAAFEAVVTGLTQYPGNPDLLAEKESLLCMGNFQSGAELTS